MDAEERAQAFAAVDVLRLEGPDLFDAQFAQQVTLMMEQAVEVEATFGADVSAKAVSGLSLVNMREYLEYVADWRLTRFGMAKQLSAKHLPVS